MLGQEGSPRRKPDLFGMTWYGILAAYCMYEITAGAKELPYLVAGPLFFSIVIFCSFFALALAIGSVTNALAGFGLAKKPGETGKRESLRQAAESFVILAIFVLFLALLSGYFYGKLETMASQELGGLGASAVFAITFLQAAIASLPKMQDGTGWRSYAERWFKGALMGVFIPSFVGVIAILAGLFAMSMLAPTGGLKTQLSTLAIYTIAIFLLAYKLFLEKAGKGPQGNIEKKEWRNKVLYALLASFVAAAALLLPINHLAGSMDQTQKYLAVFFFAYVFLAYTQAMPGWYARMLEEKEIPKPKGSA